MAAKLAPEGQQLEFVERNCKIKLINLNGKRKLQNWTDIFEKESTRISRDKK